jgi:hypothetical protein
MGKNKKGGQQKAADKPADGGKKGSKGGSKGKNTPAKEQAAGGKKGSKGKNTPAKEKAPKGEASKKMDPKDKKAHKGETGAHKASGKSLKDMSEKEIAAVVDTALANGCDTFGAIAEEVKQHCGGVSWKMGARKRFGPFPAFCGKNVKKFKAAEKEGGKKGVDMAGIADMGGVVFFHLSVDEPDGKWALLDSVMAGANKPVEEGAEERKGGANGLGKMFLSAGPNRLIASVHVPAQLQKEKKVNLAEWVTTCFGTFDFKTVVSTPELMKIEIIKNEEIGEVPLKIRDVIIRNGVDYLKEKKLLPDADSSSGSFILGEDMDW